VICSIEEGVCL